jgi:predicted TIM-barrel fold metal-dependent hydrolase
LNIFGLVVLIAATAGLAIPAYGADNPIAEIEKSIIDIHVHVAGLGYGDSGCFIGAGMRDNFRFPFYLWAMGVSEKELQEHGDRLIIAKLSRAIAESKSISKAVLLAMDGYVDSDGNLDRERTQIYVPNEYLAREVRGYDNLLFGASVNPNRKDAILRLRQAYADGAVLIKWIPSIMNIDPADPRHIPFYREMARLGLPLLSHTGMEKSFASARDELADPRRLALPLEQGVTVIAAHIATTGKTEGEENFDRILPMFARYDNLYTDISSLTQINKLGYLARAREVIGLKERMVYGTDWPLQFFPVVSPWYHLRHIGLRNALRIGGIANRWDRDVALKSAYDLPPEVFKRSALVLPAADR